MRPQTASMSDRDQRDAQIPAVAEQHGFQVLRDGAGDLVEKTQLRSMVEQADEAQPLHLPGTQHLVPSTRIAAGWQKSKHGRNSFPEHSKMPTAYAFMQ